MCFVRIQLQLKKFRKHFNLITMKAIPLIIICIFFVFGELFAQNEKSQKEKIADYIRSHTEEDCCNLFNKNGYTVLKVIKGYLQCLDGYVFYSDMIRTPDTLFKLPVAEKVFYIENGKIVEAGQEGKLTSEIAFTLTAIDRLSSDCIIFIGTNGWAYEFSLFSFNNVVPLSLELSGFSFMDNKLTKYFIYYVNADNNDKENNINYDFSSFANNLKCKASYEIVGIYSEGLAYVKQNGKYGFINEAGEEVVPLKYDNALFFQEGLAQIKLGDKWGFVDKEGKEIIPPKYDFAGRFSEGRAVVKIGEKEYYIDKTGKVINDINYDIILNYYEELAGVSLNPDYALGN